MIIIYLLMILLNLYLVHFIYKKNYNHLLSALCVFFLFIPIFSFQTLGPTFFVAIIFSIIFAGIYLALKTDVKVNNKRGIGLLLILSLLIVICGLFAFSLPQGWKMNETKDEVRLIKSNFFSWYLKQNIKKAKLSTIKSSIESYIKTNIKKNDPWNNKYKIVYMLKEDNEYLTITFEIISNGPDCRLNTKDDVKSSFYLPKKRLARALERGQPPRNNK